MFIFRRLLIRSFLILSLLAVVLWVTSHLVEIDGYRDPILSRLNHRFRIALAASRIEGILVPHTGVRVSGLRISLPGATEPIAEAGSAELRLSLGTVLDEFKSVELFIPQATFRTGRNHEELGKLYAAIGAMPASSQDPGKKRNSIFEKISLRGIRIAEASAVGIPGRVRDVVIRPGESGWLLRGIGDRDFLSLFSCPGSSLETGRISLSISRNGVTCAASAQID